jgi:O-antigen/teichoic acid export membrane protein
MAFACVISIAANMRGRFRIRDFDAALAPRIASFALPLVITCGLSYLLQWGDRYVLARLVSLGELGRYSALADLTQQTLVLVCSGLGAAWYPRIVQAWGGGQRGEAQRLLSRYALMGLAFVMPAAVGFAMLLRPVAMLMFGAAYGDLPAGLPVLLVLAAVAGGCKSFYFDVPMLLAERVWRLASGIAISASVSLAVMAWAVPIQGIRGAALGLLCGQLVGLVYSFAMGRDVLRHQVGLQQVLCVVAASAVMALVLALVAFEGAFGLVARIILGSLAYGSILLLADFDGARLRLANFVRARAGAGR